MYLPWRNRLSLLCNAVAISWFDVLVMGLLLVVGFIYLHDIATWSIGYIGDAQYGDAQFWWSGALNVAQGIFQDNPGKGFRPGYFLLTGLTLPVLGQQFQQYFPYFVFTFLIASCLFYLALRDQLGSWAAACVVGMMVFNPYTAEWVATSTTDSTGLLLNVAALSCLLFGVNKGLHRNWLIAFSILFSLATLTRPLVTPFIALVMLAILFFPRVTLQKRLLMTTCIFIAFCLPTVLWMVTQKLTIDRWAISSNDASAFYAASDPEIQVWKTTMYEPIQKLAAEYYHTDYNKIDDQQLNHMFWLEAANNYVKYANYHISRVLPHINEIASFSPLKATHGTDYWRIAFLQAIAIGLLLSLLLQRLWWRALVLAAFTIVFYFSPFIITYMTLAGSLIALLLWRREGQAGLALVSAYWLTGVMMLYFVGSTWGMPSFTATFGLNALGYRLGSQIFFVGDLLAAFFIIWLAQTKTLSLALIAQRLRVHSSQVAGGFVLTCFSLFLIATTVVYTLGSGIVAKRIYTRLSTPIQPYPSLAPVMKWYGERNHSALSQIVGEKGTFNANVFAKKGMRKGEVEIVVTGTISPFVWNLQGQQRAQVMMHTQQQIYPYTMGPMFVIVDVPQHLNINDWMGKQGAFVIRALPNQHNISNFPYYITSYALRAFIPLSEQGKDFALNHAISFPLVKNATQLETLGELKHPKTEIKWALDSGPLSFQRRFFVTPAAQTKTVGKAQLLLNTTNFSRPTTLRFSYVQGYTDNVPATLARYDGLTITTTNKAYKGQKPLLAQKHTTLATDESFPLQTVEFVIPKGTQTLDLAFNRIPPGQGIWIYEFNVSTADTK